MFKSGIKTSEFIPVLASMVTFILVSTGVIRPEDTTEIEQTIGLAISAVVTLALSIAYILSRTEIKKEALRLQPEEVKPEVLG